MRKRVEFQQRSPQWMAWRISRVGCSDLAALMGISPFKTRLQLWEEKVSGEAKNRVNTAMQRGIDYEDEARLLLSNTLGIDFQPACFENTDYPYLGASLDGWNEEKQVATEIKVPKASDHEAALTKDVPEHYYPQCQGIMMVCDLREIWYASYDPEKQELAYFLVPRDQEYCDKINVEVNKFYDSIIKMTPPEPDPERDYARFEDSEGLAEELKYANEQFALWEKKCSELKDRMIDKVGKINAYLGNAKITKITKAGSVEYKKIPELKSVNLDQYRKESVVYYKVSI